MECEFFRRRFSGYSNEKKLVIAIVLGGIYKCPACRNIHKLEVRENESQ